MKPRSWLRADEDSSVQSAHSNDPLLTPQEPTRKSSKSRDEQAKATIRSKNKSSSESTGFAKGSSKKKAKKGKNKNRGSKDELPPQNVIKESEALNEKTEEQQNNEFTDKPKGQSNEGIYQIFSSEGIRRESTSDGIYQIPTEDSITEIYANSQKAILKEESEKKELSFEDKIESKKTPEEEKIKNIDPEKFKLKKKVKKSKETLQPMPTTEISVKVGEFSKAKKKKKDKEEKNLEDPEISLTVKSLKSKKKSKEKTEASLVLQSEYKPKANEELKASKKWDRSAKCELGIRKSDTQGLLDIAEEESNVFVKSSPEESKITEAREFIVEQSRVKHSDFQDIPETDKHRHGIQNESSETVKVRKKKKPKDSREHHHHHIHHDHHIHEICHLNSENESNFMPRNNTQRRDEIGVICDESEAGEIDLTKIKDVEKNVVEKPSSLAEIEKAKQLPIEEANVSDFHIHKKKMLKKDYGDDILDGEVNDLSFGTTPEITTIKNGQSLEQNVMFVVGESSSGPTEVSKIKKALHTKPSKQELTELILEEPELKKYESKEKSLISEDSYDKSSVISGESTKSRKGKRKRHKVKFNIKPIEDVKEEHISIPEKVPRDEKHDLPGYGLVETEDFSKIKSDIHVPLAMETTLTQSLGSTRNDDQNIGGKKAEVQSTALMKPANFDEVSVTKAIVNPLLETDEELLSKQSKPQAMNDSKEPERINNENKWHDEKQERQKRTSSDETKSRPQKSIESITSNAEKTSKNNRDSKLVNISKKGKADISKKTRKSSQDPNEKDPKRKESNMSRIKGEIMEGNRIFSQNKAHSSRAKTIEHQSNLGIATKPESSQRNRDADTKRDDREFPSSAPNKDESRKQSKHSKNQALEKVSKKGQESKKSKIEKQPKISEKKRYSQEIQQEDIKTNKTKKEQPITIADVKEEFGVERITSAEKEKPTDRIRHEDVKESSRKKEEKSDSKKSKLEAVKQTTSQIKEKLSPKRKSGETTSKPSENKAIYKMNKEEQPIHIHGEIDEGEREKPEARTKWDSDKAKSSKTPEESKSRGKPRDSQKSDRKEFEERFRDFSAKVPKQETKFPESSRKIEKQRHKKTIEAKDYIPEKEAKFTEEVGPFKKEKDSEIAKVELTKERKKEPRRPDSHERDTGTKVPEVQRPRKSSETRKPIKMAHEEFSAVDPKVLKRKIKKKKTQEDMRNVNEDESFRKQYLKELAGKKRRKKSMEAIEEPTVSDEVVQAIHVREGPPIKKKSVEGIESEEYVEKIYFREFAPTTFKRESAEKIKKAKPEKKKKVQKLKTLKEDVSPPITDKASGKIVSGPVVAPEDKGVEIVSLEVNEEPKEIETHLEAVKREEELEIESKTVPQIPKVEEIAEPLVETQTLQLEDEEIQEKEEASILEYPKEVVKEVIHEIKELKIPSATAILEFIKEKVTSIFEEEKPEEKPEETTPTPAKEEVKVGLPEELPKEPCPTPAPVREDVLKLSIETQSTITPEKVKEEEEQPKEPAPSPTKETVETIEVPKHIPTETSEQTYSLTSNYTSSTEKSGEYLSASDTYKADEESSLDYKSTSMTEREPSVAENGTFASWNTDLVAVLPEDEQIEVIDLDYPAVAEKIDTKTFKINSFVIQNSPPGEADISVSSTDKELIPSSIYERVEAPTREIPILSDSKEVVDEQSEKGILPLQIEAALPSFTEIAEPKEMASSEKLEQKDSIYKLDKVDIEKVMPLEKIEIEEQEIENILRRDVETEAEGSSHEMAMASAPDVEERENHLIAGKEVKLENLCKCVKPTPVDESSLITADQKSKIISFLTGKLPSDKLDETSAILDMVVSQGSVTSDHKMESHLSKAQEESTFLGKTSASEELPFKPEDSAIKEPSSENLKDESEKLVKPLQDVTKVTGIPEDSTLPQEDIHTSEATEEGTQILAEGEVLHGHSVESEETIPDRTVSTGSCLSCQNESLTPLEEETPQPEELKESLQETLPEQLVDCPVECKTKFVVESEGQLTQNGKDISSQELEEHSQTKKRTGILDFFWDTRDDTEGSNN